MYYISCTIVVYYSKMNNSTLPSLPLSRTLLYELVALEKPFKCVPRESVVWQVGTGQFQPLSLLPRDRLRGIIQRCWRLQPESRPTFKDILTDVEQNVSRRWAGREAGEGGREGRERGGGGLSLT